jgi:hypothetical protein
VSLFTGVPWSGLGWGALKIKPANFLFFSILAFFFLFLLFSPFLHYEAKVEKASIFSSTCNGRTADANKCAVLPQTSTIPFQQVGDKFG